MEQQNGSIAINPSKLYFLISAKLGLVHPMPYLHLHPTVSYSLVALLLLIGQANGFMFCFTSHSQQPSIITQRLNTTSNLSGEPAKPSPAISQLRSYHPHYINSISYPHPITPHIYYGEVVGSKPIFHFKNIDQWSPSSIEKLTINGVEYTDASAKYYLLRREEQLRFMLVLQLQNSFEQNLAYSIDFFKRKDHYLAVFQYASQFNAYVIYITRHDQILQFNQQDLKGINVNIRNESHGSAKTNWRFSQLLAWRGRNNIVNMSSSHFVGVVLELEYFDRNLKNYVHLNLHELVNPTNLTLQQFEALEKQIDLKALLPPKMKLNKKYANCSVAATQKIFDGLSYEYGTLKIKNGYEYIYNKPQQLLSFCPSRKRFPWGFLWDDGFHCQVAIRKNEDLTIRVIKSWLDTMLDNGWIPREQNRGEQRQYLCSCPRFMQKDIKDGNPPTLLLALEYYRRSNKLNTTTFPVQYWLKIKKWYNWFLKTQKDGDIFLFGWHDSINQMGASFTSGMDDFPRPVYSRGHIDLQSWMYFFTKFMIQTAHIYSESSNEYISNLQLIKSNFQFFLDPATHLYKDIANDTTHSEHFGYPNILPIAFGIATYKSTEYNATITYIKKHLDTGAGLSSISKYSRYYLENKDSYWRGPVWININYLFLRGLKLYYPQEVQLYNKIRGDLMTTVCGNWQRSGYFYENYINGTGSFSYPFNGWTSLIAIIIEENY